MIDKIYCESTGCVHNNAGTCESGVINVKTHVDHAYSAAYCDSFATKNSLRDILSKSMPFSGDNAEMTARNMGLSEVNTKMPSDYIGCDAMGCIHNASGMCCAYSVHIDKPFSDGSLSFCKTYEQKPE